MPNIQLKLNNDNRRTAPRLMRLPWTAAQLRWGITPTVAHALQRKYR